MTKLRALSPALAAGVFALQIWCPAGPLLSPAAASVQREATGHSRSVQRLYGLKRVFLAVKASIDPIAGDRRTLNLLLGSGSALDEHLANLPEKRKNALTRKHFQVIALWQDFERVASAVLGTGYSEQGYGYAQWADAFLADISLPIQVDPAILRNDDLVSRMAALGYAPKEIADVVKGRLALQALDNAQKMLMLGQSREQVSRYLEARYRTEDSPTPLIADPSPQLALPSPADEARYLSRRSGAHRPIYDEAIVRHSARYGVDPDLVRAVIRHESNWNPSARSRAGAIGLMQLMPDTARLLGVDPHDPEQNIEGGVKYLAGLHDLFGRDLDAVLLGYIGGPLYAKSWLQGKTVPYGEVRTYLHNVKTAYYTKAF